MRISFETHCATKLKCVARALRPLATRELSGSVHRCPTNSVSFTWPKRLASRTVICAAMYDELAWSNVLGVKVSGTLAVTTSLLRGLSTLTDEASDESDPSGLRVTVPERLRWKARGESNDERSLLARRFLSELVRRRGEMPATVMDMLPRLRLSRLSGELDGETLDGCDGVVTTGTAVGTEEDEDDEEDDEDEEEDDDEDT